MTEKAITQKKVEKIFDTIGDTPLVELEHIQEEEGIEPKILGKLEMFNPTGSLKDRIFHEMITKAIERGELEPGMKIIEASTGNAGIACSFVGGLLGYDVTIVMPRGMSEERIKIMKAYGANVVLTPGQKVTLTSVWRRFGKLLKKSPTSIGRLDSTIIPITLMLTTRLRDGKFGNRLMEKLTQFWLLRVLEELLRE